MFFESSCSNVLRTTVFDVCPSMMGRLAMVAARQISKPRLWNVHARIVLPACHDTLRHVARGRLGERQYENFFRGGALRGEQPCDISDDGGGFACSRAREHEGIVARSCDCTDLLVA